MGHEVRTLLRCCAYCCPPAASSLALLLSEDKPLRWESQTQHATLQGPVAVSARVLFEHPWASSMGVCTHLHIGHGTEVICMQFMGTVMEVGIGVKTIAPGDRVVASFDIACGRCYLCKKVQPAGLPYRNLILPACYMRKRVQPAGLRPMPGSFIQARQPVGEPLLPVPNRRGCGIISPRPFLASGSGGVQSCCCNCVNCHGEDRCLRTGAWRSHIHCMHVPSDRAAAAVLHSWCCRRPTHAATPPTRTCR